MRKKGYLLVNFGGPRTLEEVEPFLCALLRDKDVIRSHLPQLLHNLFLDRVAKKRAHTIKHDYTLIGGGSPIWRDTEYIAQSLYPIVQAPVLTFHRYLTQTHKTSIAQLKALDCDEILVFPMFPQFTFATTGSIARCFKEQLPVKILNKLRWVRAYGTHPGFIQEMVQNIKEYLEYRGLAEKEIFFLFSAHGLPQQFINEGDVYNYECQSSFETIMEYFPQAEGILCYQSKFGRGEWLKPYTQDICIEIDKHNHGRRHCVFVPIGFTSDHIETLVEVEQQYMPLIKKKGLYPFRVPALNRRPGWIRAIGEILATSGLCPTTLLISR